MFDLNETLQLLLSGNPNKQATASADLANAAWNKDISEDQVMSLLEHNDDRVRSCLAWAVWDAGRPQCAVVYLRENGCNDPSDIVRSYTLSIWADAKVPILGNPGFLKFLEDENPSIRQRARMILETPG